LRTVAQVVRKTKALGQRLLTPGKTLSQRVVHAGFWAFSFRIVDRLFGLARTVVLARLLAPADFGLYGIALLALSMLETFSETGFNAAIIQKKGDVKPYLDTAWTVQAIRGFLLALLLLVIAPYVATFFGEPGAASLVRALALVVVLRGLVNIGVLYFRKELEFHKEFLYMFSGTLVEMAVAIPAALILQNAWALISGLVAGQFVRVVVSYFVHPYRPRPRLERSKVTELYTYGRWIFGAKVAAFLALYGDDIFVGRVLGAAALGFYQLAFRFSNMMATEVTHVTSEVTFPAYAKLQSDTSKLKEAFLRTLEAIMAITLTLAVGIVMLGPSFVYLFLGTKWIPIIPALQILAISGFIRSIVATGGALFRGAGKPEIDFWMNLARVGVMAILIYPLTTSLGITGTAITAFLGIVGTLPIWWYAVSRITKCHTRELLTSFSPALLGSGIMVLIVWFLMFLLEPTSHVYWIVLVIIATIAYFICQLVLWRYGRRGFFKTIKFILEVF